MKIRIENLRFSLGAFTLRVAGLAIAAGRLTAVVGPNGAGKSTLLKCLAAVHAPPQGAVFIDGQDLAALSGKSRARLVGYVPQEPSFVFNYGVLDFVLTGRAAFLPVFSSPAHQDIEAARDALRIVGLSGFEDRTLFDLSSGERRLVLIARTLAQQSVVLLLDEPTTFLDPRHEADIMGLVRRLAVEMGKTVIVTLHALDMALKYADEMVFLKGGEVVAVGPPFQVLTEPLLKAVYEIDMDLVDVGGKRLIVR
jgi:iron complex transport system ATP-binding protein